MIGIDLTTISRFKNKSETFVKTILSEQELIEYNLAENKELFLATRWAIKEALFKCDNSLLPFSKINIKKEDRKYKFENYSISTSSEGDLYIAIAKKEN